MLIEFCAYVLHDLLWTNERGVFLIALVTKGKMGINFFLNFFVYLILHIERKCPWVQAGRTGCEPLRLECRKALVQSSADSFQFFFGRRLFSHGIQSIIDACS